MIYQIVQAVVIGCVVFMSGWFAFKWIFPGLYLRLISALSVSLLSSGMPYALRCLGQWLAPENGGFSSGCASGGCSQCRGCDVLVEMGVKKVS